MTSTGNLAKIRTEEPNHGIPTYLPLRRNANLRRPAGARRAYHNHSEYVRDLIRHDQERRARERVDTLLLEGLGSGEPVPMTRDDWREIREQVREEAARRLETGG